MCDEYGSTHLNFIYVALSICIYTHSLVRLYLTTGIGIHLVPNFSAVSLIATWTPVSVS